MSQKAVQGHISAFGITAESGQNEMIYRLFFSGCSTKSHWFWDYNLLQIFPKVQSCVSWLLTITLPLT